MSARPNAVTPSSHELALGLRSLASLLGSSMPLTRALIAFETIAPPPWRSVVPSIRTGVRNGRALSSAIEESALHVPLSLLGVIRAGEERGALAESVRDAAEIAAQQSRARREITTALAYPLLLLVAGSGTLGLMIFVVLPKFAALLSEADLVVPRFTQFMLTGGAISRENGPYAIAAVAVILFLTRSWLKEPVNQVAFNRALLSLPIVGPIRIRLASARLCTTLAGLLRSGVPLVRALDVSAGALGDAAMAARAREARRAIVGGASATVALSEAGA